VQDEFRFSKSADAFYPALVRILEVAEWFTSVNSVLAFASEVFAVND
jgi:hypothetical protein